MQFIDSHIPNIPSDESESPILDNLQTLYIWFGDTGSRRATLRFTLSNTEENITNLKQTTGSPNFVIEIQDYIVQQRIMQCFRCQGIGHKAEYCNRRDRCACAREIIHPALTQKMHHCLPSVRTAKGTIQSVTRGAHRQRNRGGNLPEPFSLKHSGK